MAATEVQKADIYFFCGWPQRYVQVNTALEQAIDSIAQKPEQWAILTNSLTQSPKGILAQLRDLHDVQIPGAYKRLKARKVGSIELSGSGELNELRNQGRRLVGALCDSLGVLRDGDVFGSGRGSRSGSANIGGILSRGPGAAGNWIGK